ncbi:MAG: DUF4981 domain-containing protein [Bacteroidales bacterium]|jgi:hypothetical protein|nr:DUF4981 domain-containing protein [Bacteroidales bacterium]
MNKIILSLFVAFFIPISGIFAQTDTQIQYLSGTDKDNTVPWAFFCTSGNNSGYWTTIPVPSQWELQGFGTYNFGREFWTYGSRFRFADEKGLYKHPFTVPASWKDREVWIVFEGSMTDTEVTINGKKAGDIHQGSFYEFKYNITDKLVLGGDNLLEVTVSKMSSNNSVNQAERYADYWVFGGIYRPVYLASYPKKHISHFTVDAKADGSFSVDVTTANLTKNLNLTANISYAGRQVASFSGRAVINSEKNQITGKVSGVKTWTAETPEMYQVDIVLADGNTPIHTVHDVFGFRTVETRAGDGIYLNGVKIKMKGVNRHEFWPQSGRTVSREVALLDITRVKEMNMNAIRCSHYPPDKRFLYLCDSLGVYVIDELAGWQSRYDTEVGTILVREMVERDVNHPSILLWSNGNEGGHNTDLDDDYALYDPSKRTVIHASYSMHRINGIDCNHYPTLGRVQQSLSSPEWIYMCTEFLHCQDDGGGGAGLEDFWEVMWAHPRSAGGFLWALLDESVLRTDRGGMIDAQMVNTNDGILGPHREKEGSFYAIKEIFSPVKIRLRQLTANFNGEIPVENRYHFTNLNQLTFNWELVSFRNMYDIVEGHTVIRSGSFAGPNVAPADSGVLKLNLPASWKNADALYLSIVNPKGEEILKLSYRIRTNADLIADLIQKSGTGNVVLTQIDTFQRRPRGMGGRIAPASATPNPPVIDSLFFMSANGLTVVFNKFTGMIMQLRNMTTENQLKLINGPVLLSGKQKVNDVKHYAQGETQVLEFIYEGDMKYVRWTMYPSGWLEMDYAYSLTGEYDFTGISFNYPERNIIGIRWLGNGPYRVWKNRPQGMNFGVWAKLFNDTQTGSFPWFYPEFKGYHSDMVWMQVDAVEGRFYVASAEENLYARWGENFYAFVTSGIPHPTIPVGGISFLDNIPPTGTKMAINFNQRPQGLGPMSHTNTVDGAVTRKLYFYFGYPDSK